MNYHTVRSRLHYNFEYNLLIYNLYIDAQYYYSLALRSSTVLVDPVATLSPMIISLSICIKTLIQKESRTVGNVTLLYYSLNW